MTTRDLTAAVETALQAAVARPILFVEAVFGASGSPDSQFLRLWTGFGQITWDSKVWTGSADALTFSPIEESAKLEATGVRIGLSGIPVTNVSLALGSLRQGRACKVWLGFLDSTGAVISDPYQSVYGRIDTGEMEDGPETSNFVITVESRLLKLFRPEIRRYTHEDQQIDYPGDLGFIYVPSLVDRRLVWGGPAPVSSVVGDSGGGVSEGGTGRRTFGGGGFGGDRE